MSDPRDDDLRALLDRLEDDLEALRIELEADDDRRRPSRRRRSDRRERSSPLPRPPRPGAFLRFTESYTIPTVISLLEATIQSLELLRGVLRVVDPGRSIDREERGTVQTRLNDAGRFAADRASNQLGRRLDDLQTALSEANLPRESESRSLIEDIRDLSAEIEARIADSERAERERRDRDGGRGTTGRNDSREDGTERGRSRGNGDDRGVRIDVFDERDESHRDESGRDESADGGGENDSAGDPQVDIESELDSIREEVHGAQRGEDQTEGDDRRGDEDGDEGPDGEER